MAFAKKVSRDTPSTEEVAEIVGAATGGILSQTLLGNSFLSGMIGTAGSLVGASETCEESAQDSWLENFVEGIFGSFGIGNDPDCESESGTETAPTTAPAPEVDLTQYAWLLTVYVSSGVLGQVEAEALLAEASAEQLAATLQVGDAEVVEAGATMPEADLEADDNNRAKPLDWEAPVAAGHITPEASETEAGGAALEDVFQAHLADMMVEEFGAGVTLDQVRGAITLASSMGRSEVSAALQARLARANQYAMVATLNVEDSGRYAPNGATTFCNIYAYDLVTAMGAYIPRTWWYNSAIARIQAGESVTPIYGETVRELDANSLNAWMQEWGGAFGWQKAASMTAAQEAANAGSVVVILADGLGVPGHISVVLAEKDGYSADRGSDGSVYAPMQSQAGAVNANHDTLSQGEGSAEWWEDSAHADGAAWINTGSASSPIITPESMGR